MKIVVVASFQNEEPMLPRFLDSVRCQDRLPDLLLLVDDGSTDRSRQIAEAFSREVGFARLLVRGPHRVAADRLAAAPELKAFQWALESESPDYDVVVKMDADLELTATTFRRMEEEFLADPELGIGGFYLSIVADDGSLLRERCPPGHVRGATKFYRRECFSQIQPIPSILGWDTIDEVTARMHGWKTRSCALPEGDPIHLRPTGDHDGRLRAFRRWGECAYGYGADPFFTVTKAFYLSLRRPRLAGVNYLWGWLSSRLKGRPRAAREVRRQMRVEQRKRLRGAMFLPIAAGGER